MIIGRAYNELNQYNWGEEERFIYNQDKKRENDNLSSLNQKFDESMQSRYREKKNRSGKKLTQSWYICQLNS
ncbi:hypothetical protein [Wolbachia endosymbiont of Brugia malayi]|uniref:hypothetical protein n=1 Tax=Wolbachia endosymbiont of Brugia malayi TaxID=80849 RepID=UPI0002E17AE9